MENHNIKYLTVVINFINESNLIEGITKEPSDAEVAAYLTFLDLPRITIPDLKKFVATIQPYAELRDSEGLDVRVGSHRPPPGGPEIVKRLKVILKDVEDKAHPYNVHVEYETLHPFMDGNGRSGRALWLWQMKDQLRDTRLGFKHTWYYQSLENSHKFGQRI
jgi:hypothetical protein